MRNVLILLLIGGTSTESTVTRYVIKNKCIILSNTAKYLSQNSQINIMQKKLCKIKLITLYIYVFHWLRLVSFTNEYKPYVLRKKLYVKNISCIM